jgi:hypothetical protein
LRKTLTAVAAVGALLALVIVHTGPDTEFIGLGQQGRKSGLWLRADKTRRCNRSR